LSHHLLNIADPLEKRWRQSWNRLKTTSELLQKLLIEQDPTMTERFQKMVIDKLPEKNQLEKTCGIAGDNPFFVWSDKTPQSDDENLPTLKILIEYLQVSCIAMGIAMGDIIDQSAENINSLSEEELTLKLFKKIYVYSDVFLKPLFHKKVEIFIKAPKEKKVKILNQI